MSSTAQSSHENEKLALIAEITAAFKNVERGDGITLHEAQVIDNYGSAEERAYARTKDAETCWQDVPDDSIFSGYSVLSFLDEKGLHYYLPAYLVWYLRYIDNESVASSSMAFEAVIFKLTHRISEDGPVRFKSFTRKQSQAVANFLLFAAQQEEASERQWLTESLSRGGLTAAEIETVLQDHEFEIQPRQALDNYWGQFLNTESSDAPAV